MRAASIMIVAVALFSGCSEQPSQTVTAPAAQPAASPVAGCAQAINDFSVQADARLAAIDKACDHLTQQQQDESAQLATKNNGTITYLPPYEAKAARLADKSVK